MGMVFSLIILVITIPAYGVSPTKDPIDYVTTTDDSMIECRSDQTLVFSNVHKSYFCLDNTSVIEWVELGLVEIVGNKTISVSPEIDSAECKGGFLPIFRYQFEGIICTPEETANLWAELGIAEIMQVSNKSAVCGENMVMVIRNNESSKSSNKVVCVTVDTAERWIASGMASLVGFEAVEKVSIEKPEMIEEIMIEEMIEEEIMIEEMIEEMVEKEMIEEEIPEITIQDVLQIEKTGMSEIQFESAMTEIYNFYMVSNTESVDMASTGTTSVWCNSGDFVISGGFSVLGNGADVEIFGDKPLKDGDSFGWQIWALNESDSEADVTAYAFCAAF